MLAKQGAKAARCQGYVAINRRFHVGLEVVASSQAGAFRGNTKDVSCGIPLLSANP